jgi:hypothetical protein
MEHFGDLADALVELDRLIAAVRLARDQGMTQESPHFEAALGSLYLARSQIREKV